MNKGPSKQSLDSCIYLFDSYDMIHKAVKILQGIQYLGKN